MKLSLAAAALLAVALPRWPTPRWPRDRCPTPSIARPRPRPPRRRRRPPPPPPAAPATPANETSEDALRAFIAGVQAGRIDYAPMSTDLAAKVREQEPGSSR